MKLHLLLPLFAAFFSYLAMGQEVDVTIPILPEGKKIQVVYSTQVVANPTVSASGAITLTQQARLTADGQAETLADDPTVSGSADPVVINGFANVAPTVALASAADITAASGTDQSINLTYSDDGTFTVVDVSTIDTSDISVSGPGGALVVSGASEATSTDGSPKTGVYTISAPGGSWDFTDNGTYTISMLANQVSDIAVSGTISPLSVAANSNLGSFDVNIPAPSHSIAALSAVKNEGNSGTTPFTFTITRAGDTSVATSVNWAISLAGDLTASDFSASSGTVNFAGGETSKTLTVQVVGDTEVESDEAFSVTISSPLPSGAVIGTATASGSITNDDLASPINIALAVLEGSVAPGGTGTLQVTLTNPNATEDATGIRFSLDLDVALSGLRATGLPSSDVVGTGSQLSGTSLINLTGGTILAGDSAVFDVNLQVPGGAAKGTYNLQSSSITATLAGSAIVGTGGNTNLEVGDPQIQVELVGSKVVVTGSPVGDALTFSTLASPDRLAITLTSSGELITSSSPNVTLTGTTLATIPLSSIGGASPQIQFDAGAGNDQLTIDQSGGVIPRIMGFNGETGINEVIVTGGTVDRARITESVAGSGQVLTDTFSISYSSVGAPVRFESVSNELTITTANVDQEVVLSGIMVPNFSQVSTGLGNAINFRFPIDSFSLNGGSGNDQIQLNTLDPQFDALFVVDGRQGTDSITSASSFSLVQTSTVDARNILLRAESVRHEGVFNNSSATGVRGRITITADEMDFSGGSFVGVGSIELLPQTKSATIGIGDGSVGTLNLDAADLAAFADGFQAISVGAFGGPGGRGDVDIRSASLSDVLIVRGNNVEIGGFSSTQNIVLDAEGLIEEGATTPALSANQWQLKSRLAPGGDGVFGVFQAVTSFSTSPDATVLIDFGGTQADRVDVTGTVAISPASTLSLNRLAAVPLGTVLTILSNDGAEPVNGSFAGLSEGGSVTVDGQLFQISYVGGDGNDVTLTAGVPEIEFSQASYTYGENGAATGVAVTLVRDLAIGDSTVSVTFPGSGTAAAGSDYIATPVTVNFTGGSLSETVSLNLTQDSIVELDETLGLSVSAVTNANIGAQNTATVTITNDDSASLTINDIVVNEGNSGASTAQLTVTLDSSVDQAVSVDFATQDGTAQNSDYTPNSGTLNFSGIAGETQTVDVSILGDNLVELSENLQVLLSNVLAGGRDVTIGDSSGQITVTNDDSAVINLVGVSINEGSSGTTQANFQVTLSHPVDTAISFDYATSDGTATAADSDYQSLSSSTSFGAATTTAIDLTVVVNGDSKVELDESFNLALSNLVASGRSVTINTTSAQGTIRNDDSSALSIDDVILTEGNSGSTNAQLTVSLSNAVDQAFTVNFATQPGSAGASDFTAQNGTLNFSGDAGETQTISVPILGDETVELDETLQVILSSISAGGRGITFSDATGEITVTNDDQSVVSLEVESVDEGDSGSPTLTYTARLSQPVDVPVTLSFATGGGTATAGDDFVASGSNLTATVAGASTSVTILPDNAAEADETITGILSSLAASGRDVVFDGGASTLSNDGTILNDDFRPLGEADGIYTVTEDSILVVSDSALGVLSNDTDADDGDGPANLTAVLVADPSHGDLALNVDGTFTYSPDANYFGSDQFTYRTSDGTNEGEVTVVDIEVEEQVDLALAVDLLQPVLVAGGDAFDVFRFTVTNNGPSNATGIILSQATVLPAGLSLTNAQASVGSFAGGDWSLDLAEGQSATLTIALQADSSAASGTDSVNFEMVVASADQPDADSANDSASAAVSIISADDTSAVITAASALEQQSGLFVSQVTVTNNNTTEIPAFRLYVKNLPDDVSVYNAAGVRSFNGSDGLPYLSFNQSLAPGASVTLSVEFFRPSLDPDFAPEYEVELLPFTETTPVLGGEVVPVTRTLLLANGDYLIEVASNPGQTFAVEYSDDMVNWKRAEPSVQAVANRLQWIDNGAPKTESHPSEAAQRFYRFILLTSPR